MRKGMFMYSYVLAAICALVNSVRGYIARSLARLAASRLSMHTLKHHLFLRCLLHDLT